ncbi:hypothetical protein QBC32DRAFT_215012, partial [Pseudoneurospora amorphoporcata]
ESFATFLIKFERLLYAFRANKWPEDVKFALIRRAVLPDICENLRFVSIPKDYDEFVTKVQKLVGGGSASINYGYSHSSSSYPNSYTGNSSDHMDISNIKIRINTLDLTYIPDNLDEDDLSEPDNEYDDFDARITEVENYYAK